MNTFLIIEKERSIRKALCLSLKHSGHKVYNTGSFSEGCSLARSVKMDLIIIDDGVFNTTKNLSEIAVNNTPLLILSDYGNGCYKDIGCAQVRVLHKPFPLKQFYNRICNLLYN
jgi:DNA-binding response OmpR family regulator